MESISSHYVLFSQCGESCQPGRWRFILRGMDGLEEFEASDLEPGVEGQRLELLAIVRGLEALDKPARVTL